MKNIPFRYAFTRRLIRPDTWVVHLGANMNATATYVLCCSEKALVIDTGEHTCDLRSYVQTITDLPLVVANTHSHFDHTGNNYQFSDCPIYMSSLATQEVKKNIHSYLNPADFQYNYEAIGVEEGFQIDLGGRTVEAIAFGCHSITSFLWLDRKNRLLFTGDEIETGQVLLMGREPEQCIELYLQNLQKVEHLRDAGIVDLLCPAHNGSLVDSSFITTLIENCEHILGGELGSKDISSATFMVPGSPQMLEREKRIEEIEKHPEMQGDFQEPDVRRSEWKGSSIVYDTAKIYYTPVACAN